MALGLDEDDSTGLQQQVQPGYLIVRNFDSDVFTDDTIKSHFEDLFQPYDCLKLTYLPSFSRVIAAFADINCAKRAQTCLHGERFRELELQVYLKDEAKQIGDELLALPKAEKLFLISPPASPPVGWEPIEEPIPVVNYDLLSAVAKLEDPGKPVTLISATDMTPSIVVVGCEDPVSRTGKNMISMSGVPQNELQTKRPPVNNI